MFSFKKLVPVAIALAAAAFTAAGPVSDNASPSVNGSDTLTIVVGNTTSTGASADAPAPDASDANGNILLCVDINFTGSCVLFAFFNNVCNNVPVGFNDRISSVRPDPGVTCTLFQHVNCEGRQVLNVIYPGIPDLRVVGFNDEMSSFRCTT